MMPQDGTKPIESSKIIEIRLNIGTFSVNSIYNCGNARLGKTVAAQTWSTACFKELHEHLDELKKLRESFNPSTHGYSIEIHAFLPNFYTKKGNISNKTHDISNFEKPLIDLIFLPKYFENQYPYGCQNLNIDDKHIISLTSSKQLTNEEKPYIIVRLSHIPLKKNN